MGEHFDTLIVGSGVAAVAVASELLQANPSHRVLLIEAGPRVEMKNFRLWEDFLVTGQKPYEFCLDKPYPAKDSPGQNAWSGATQVPLRDSRLMMVGGSTTHWGGWSFRMKPEDFKGAHDGPSWPLCYDELAPDYDAAERFIGVAGSRETAACPRDGEYPFPAYPYTREDGLIIEAFKQRGIDYGHLPIARHGAAGSDSPIAPCQTTGTCKYCPFGARFVAANILDLLLARYPTLELRNRVVVERLVMNDQQTVRGVMARDHCTGVSSEVRADRVILAAGALESPKLLLRSTSDVWPDGVGNQHDLVGRNLITHPYFSFTATLPCNPDQLRPQMDFPTLVSRHFDSADEQPLGKFILVNPAGSPSLDIADLMHKGNGPEAIRDALCGPTTISLQGMVETLSDPKNRVSNLKDKTNQFGLPQTKIEYSQPDCFDARLKQIEHIVDQIFGAIGAEGTELQFLSWRADHAAATCRMADAPKDGVVDANLKVHGVDNLFVCSNAVFPTLGAVNPTLTLTALSLRLGKHLAGGPS